jgi:hypothetical protein
LEDLLAAHEATIPSDDKNPIRVTQAARALLSPEYSKLKRELKDWLPTDGPNRLPRANDAATAAEARDLAAAALARARRLRDLSQSGGVRLTIAPDGISIPIPHTQGIPAVAALLQLDAVLAAYQKDADRAVASAHAGVHAARAVGDEPFLLSMLVRIECSTLARDSTERVLGLCEPTTGLDELQAAFTAEADVPLVTIALRGERAVLDHTFENMAAGTVSPSVVTAASDGPPPLPGTVSLYGVSVSNLPADHACMLETLTRYVEISRKPTHEALPLYSEVPAPPNELRTLFTRLMLPSCGIYAKADARAKAKLKTAATGIACERFRRANGRWPRDLTEVPKDTLPVVPLDPYDGQPLRFRRTPAGIVIYSIGPDGTDDGGTVSPRGEAGTDLGFRLYDPAYRRAAPLPKPDGDDKP